VIALVDAVHELSARGGTSDDVPKC
jgi:hypothetical protein